MKCVRKTVDLHLKGVKKGSLRCAREIFAATEAGSPSRPLFVQSLHSLLRKIRGETAQEGKEGDLAAAFLHQELQVQNPIRDMFLVHEEAFLLMIIRKHLLKIFGPKVAKAIAPRRFISGRSLPLLPSLDRQEEVSSADHFQARDILYYQQLCVKLEMEDTLQDSSVFCSLLDVVSMAGTADKRKQSNSHQGGGDGMKRRRFGKG